MLRIFVDSFHQAAHIFAVRHHGFRDEMGGMDSTLNVEGFVAWAMDPARTVEERYPVELLVEHSVSAWHYRNQTPNYRPPGLQEHVDKKRERRLNPAYQPHYTELDLRRSLEIVSERNNWETRTYYHDRPVRNVDLLRFMPQLQEVKLYAPVTDVSPLLHLPNLRKLEIGGVAVEDFRFLEKLTGLRTLTVSFGCHWPELGDFTLLDKLEELNLTGNLLAMQAGLMFSKVRRGTLNCSPLAARSVRDLPQFPACEFLTLAGVERLEGIEAFPLLRNLTLQSPVRDFSPLAALEQLTCLFHSSARPLDVSPLVRVPKLHYVSFSSQHTYGQDKDPLRDLWPLVESRTLREISVTGCPPLQLEVEAINASLPPCEDLYLLETPRPVAGPVKMIVAPHNKLPHRERSCVTPGEPELIDVGLRQSEGRWVRKFVEQRVTERIGHSDWGKVECSGEGLSFTITIECYEVVERFPEFVELARECMAILKRGYVGCVWVMLRVPPPEPTEAQKKLQEQFDEEQEKAEFEQRMKEHREYLENLRLFQIKQQQGEEVDPKEFTPEKEPPPPAPPWEREDEDDEEEGSGNFMVKKKPEPPPSRWDDEHPLAHAYNIISTVTLEEVWFYHHARDLAVHLMGREPDVEFQPEQKE